MRPFPKHYCWRMPPVKADLFKFYFKLLATDRGFIHQATLCLGENSHTIDERRIRSITSIPEGEDRHLIQLRQTSAAKPAPYRTSALWQREEPHAGQHQHDRRHNAPAPPRGQDRDPRCGTDPNERGTGRAREPQLLEGGDQLGRAGEAFVGVLLQEAVLITHERMVAAPFLTAQAKTAPVQRKLSAVQAQGSLLVLLQRLSITVF